MGRKEPSTRKGTAAKATEPSLCRFLRGGGCLQQGGPTFQMAGVCQVCSTSGALMCEQWEWRRNVKHFFRGLSGRGKWERTKKFPSTTCIFYQDRQSVLPACPPVQTKGPSTVVGYKYKPKRYFRGLSRETNDNITEELIVNIWPFSPLPVCPPHKRDSF